ncbi:CBS domain-containing protein [Streptosporangium sp. NBC_01755]|uniref:CBS domain-containing protein n=1 Tax=unclassified Streptosporangium TaxID=2632669 RepID=UPI002DD7EF58|nr:MULTISPECIES: CBS domain-containing protein [unclassified Streptosporangium]WSA28157.1 CBS domain-containing protein [Streptosporangium sp. NBC_01810]WSD00367.1 CBS domain-containing protein [Streptosporangium sp. NBC_01755]
MRVKVSEVMTRAVASVNGSTPFKDVAEVLIAHGVSAVPVVDAENHVLGVVSEADLLAKEEFKEQYYREGYRPPLRARLRYRLSREGRSAEQKAHGDTAAELMTAPAVTIAPNAPVVSAMRLMDEHGVKRLPVVDREGRLEGIVSRQDLLKVFLRQDDEIAREIREDVLDHSLWVDTSQVKVTVHQGIAKLSGRMARRSDTLIAARMALRVHGVVDLIDELEWDEDDTPTWQSR